MTAWSSVKVPGTADGYIVLGRLCDYAKRRARLNGSTEIGIETNELSDNPGPGSFAIGSCK